MGADGAWESVLDTVDLVALDSFAFSDDASGTYRIEEGGYVETGTFQSSSRATGGSTTAARSRRERGGDWTGAVLLTGRSDGNSVDATAGSYARDLSVGGEAASGQSEGLGYGGSGYGDDEQGGGGENATGTGIVGVVSGTTSTGATASWSSEFDLSGGVDAEGAWDLAEGTSLSGGESRSWSLTAGQGAFSQDLHGDPATAGAGGDQGEAGDGSDGGLPVVLVGTITESASTTSDGSFQTGRVWDPSAPRIIEGNDSGANDGDAAGAWGEASGTASASFSMETANGLDAVGVWDDPGPDDQNRLIVRSSSALSGSGETRSGLRGEDWRQTGGRSPGTSPSRR